jgi:glutamate synthase (NADPH/NADH) large chain/glutamate synthase (ferredoxin)
MVALGSVLSTDEQLAALPRALWHRDESDEAQLKKMLEEHSRRTGSKRARELLDNWAASRARFVKVFPLEYRRALGEISDKKMALSHAHIVKNATKYEAVLAKENASKAPA